MTQPEQLPLPGLRPFMRSYRPRPTRADVLPAAVEALVDRIAADWAEPGFYRDEWVASLVGVLADSGGRGDGWSLCRDLERDGWDVDSQLVEIMDDAEYFVADALAAAEALWVEDAAVTLALPLGTPVTVKLPRHGAVSGRVVGLDPRRATYTVCVPSLGHTESGPGTRGRVLPAEAVPGGISYEPLLP